MNHFTHWRRVAALSVCLLVTLWLSLAPTSVYARDYAQNVVDKQESINPTSVKLDQLIIGIAPDQTDEEAAALIAGRGLKLVKHWPTFGAILVNVEGAPAGSVDRMRVQASSISAQQAFTALDQTRQSLSQLPGVDYVSFNGRIMAASVLSADQYGSAASGHLQIDPPTPPLVEPTPNDPDFVTQWALNVIRVVDGWNISQGAPDVVVAVIDSGYNLTHPDLNNTSLWVNRIEKTGLPGVDDDNNGFVDDFHGWDWHENDNLMNDTFGHGTHVGGTIAATTNNQIGISGIGRNVKVMPLRILDEQGGGDIADLVDALDYAINKNVRIANLSLVAPTDFPALADAVQGVSDQIMIVAATGNTSANVYWPAAYPETVAVAATDINEGYATFSNSGPEVDLAAPGVDILSTDDGTGYVDNTGTSMATPHVSALAALVSSLRPDFSNTEILDVIKNSAIDINAGENRGRDEFIGYGRVDAYAALLNASAGLQLEGVEEVDEFIFARHAVEYNINLHTPPNLLGETLPVQGAVMHYKLIATGSTPPTSPPIGGEVLTEADGTADIVFVAPDKTGSYVLRTQVGQESFDFPLMVYPLVSNVVLDIASEEIPAGTGQTLITVEAFDSTGSLMSESIPIKLEVDAGTFSNGQQTLNLYVDSGTYTINYYADTLIGTANVTATIAGVLTETDLIQIASSTPDTLELTSDVTILETVDGEDTARLTVRVRDIYDNPMSSAYLVHLTTNLGSISPAVFQSADNDGAMVATLKVPPSTTGKADIWAVLPNTNLIAKLKIQVIGEVYTLLPLMVSGNADEDTLDDPPPANSNSTCGGLAQEAEDGLLVGNFEAFADAAASNGQYVAAVDGSGHFWTGPDAGHYAQYCFNVPTDQTYALRGKVHGADDLSDSFYVQVDDVPDGGYVWDITPNASYEVDFVSDRDNADPVLLPLTAGEHIVKIYAREDGARLDTIELVPFPDLAAASVRSASINEQDANQQDAIQQQTEISLFLPVVSQ